jgi:O-antigen/teichoic acid export membrane protein
MFRLQFSALSAAYTGFGRYGEFDFIDSAAQLAEFAAMALAIIVTKDAGSVAIALSLLRLTALLFAWRRLRQHEAWIFEPIFAGTFAELRRIAVPATMFMIYPLGTAINTQGFTTLVSYTFGPVAVVSFTTIRTFVRLIDQLISIIYRFVQPEIAIASGTESFETMRKLHRISVKLGALASLVAGILLVTVGTKFYAIWTLGRFQPDYGLIFLFLTGTIIRSIWYPSAMVVAGLNKHSPMSVFFLFVTVLSFGVAMLLARSTGSLLSVAAATLLADISLLWYVPRRALALTQDRPIIFFRSFFLSDDYLFIFRTSLKLLHLKKSVAT